MNGPYPEDVRPWHRPAGLAVALSLAVAAAILATAWLGIVLTRDAGQVAAIWLANGILAGVLVRLPRPLWPLQMLAAGIAFITANMATGGGAVLSVALTTCNLVEAALFAVILLRFDRRADLSRPMTMAGLCLAAFGPPVAFSGIGAAALLNALTGAPFFDVLATWYPADVLGLLIVVPLILSLRRRDLAALLRPGQWPTTLLLLGMVLLTTGLVFAQSGFPLLFLVFLPLAFTALRLGLAGGALAIAGVTAIALAGTLLGLGPMALMGGQAEVPAIFTIQIFLAAASLAVLPIASVFADQKRLEADLRAAKSLAETSESAHARAAQILSTTLENMDQGLIMVDGDARVRLFNEKALQMLDLPADLLAGEPHATEVLAFQQARGDFDGMPGEERPQVQAFQDMDRVTIYERPGPGGRILEVRSAPMPSGGFVRTYSDVTAKRRGAGRVAEPAPPVADRD